MNREIKFRGMSLNGWVYGYYLIIEQGAAPATPCIWHIGNNEGIPVKIESVGQSTGLKDKAGDEIYEGNILYDEYNDEYGLVVFNNGLFEFEWDNVTEDLFERCENLEIAGNYYENKELLKEETE